MSQAAARFAPADLNEGTVAPTHARPRPVAAAGQHSVRRQAPARSRGISARAVRSGPDRLAMWAVVLGVFMVALAGATAQAGSDEKRSAPAPQTVELSPK
ncbi:MAG: hypothetical protein H0U42_01515 [Thermoleophilaceae bacterium]|nr:hypothetical protein [Thermoleophilaceae bacterium]